LGIKGGSYRGRSGGLVSRELKIGGGKKGKGEKRKFISSIICIVVAVKNAVAWKAQHVKGGKRRWGD